MGFEDIPEDTRESYPCPECEAGNVTLNEESGLWECSECEWKGGVEDSLRQDLWR